MSGASQGTGDTHDFVGIGLGPFNLGLAALTEPVPDLDGVFLEARGSFDWHPGTMLPDATLQVPFLADLVTMADPTSPYSFLSFLKQTGRLYPFYIRESFHPLRREYNQYCQWVADRLASVRFGRAVERVGHDGDTYVVTCANGETYRAPRVVLGTGTTPYVPDALASLMETGEGPVVHSAHYLGARPALQGQRSITIVGSGQSAAEIYLDLLDGIDEHGYALTWVTRSPRFFPMEYTKLSLELTSPEYTHHFQSLPGPVRAGLLRDQRHLYKGISGDLVDTIYDRLYARSVAGGTDTTLLTAAEVVDARAAGGGYLLDLSHTESGETYRIRTDAVVLATGYRAGVPDFLRPVRHRIRWDGRGRYAASETYAVDLTGKEIFVQNGEEHTHGFVAPDLGMGAYRNSVILRELAGREVYPVEERIAFQEFGVPARLREEVRA